MFCSFDLHILKANEDIQLEFNKNERRLIRQKRGEKVHFHNSRSYFFVIHCKYALHCFIFLCPLVMYKKLMEYSLWIWGCLKKYLANNYFSEFGQHKAFLNEITVSIEYIFKN